MTYDDDRREIEKNLIIINRNINITIWLVVITALIWLFRAVKELGGY